MENKIKLYIHCRKCVVQKPKNKSASEYSRIEIGKTDDGIQIWCCRHNESIAFIPYEWPHKLQDCKCEKCEEKRNE